MVLEEGRYVQLSEELKKHLTDVVDNQPVRLSLWDRLLGHKPPANIGVLADEKYRYQLVRAGRDLDGKITNAEIATYLSKSIDFRIYPRASLEFNSNGVVINDIAREKGMFTDDLDVQMRANISAAGVNAEISFSNIIDAWNNWNRSTARSWHKKPIIIQEQDVDSIAIRSRYNNKGRLVMCLLDQSKDASSVCSVDLLSFFISKEMVGLQGDKKDQQEGINWAKIHGRETPQAELSSPIILKVGSRLNLAVYLGTFKASELSPLAKGPKYTLRFRPSTEDDQYDRAFYPNFFNEVEISSNLDPSLEEIVKRGYFDVERFFGSMGQLGAPFLDKEICTPPVKEVL